MIGAIMAGLPNYEKEAAKKVRTICTRFNCAYANPNSSKALCQVKYDDEVVRDFEDPAGCQAAAVFSGIDVVPGSMTAEGFTQFPDTKPLFKDTHIHTLEHTIVEDRRVLSFNPPRAQS